MKIHILSPEMASRIAAGEVVERPASVVKELIENSLDAGATEISLSIEKSGTARIRVSDNGEGMSPEDLSLAVERHSTSKLKDESDLFRIGTLGFRGEALPSIGSVSKMEIVSRPASAAMAYGICVDGDKKSDLFPTAAPFGTTIDVKDLFFNTPARRKFLKSPATELGHVCDAVNRMALAYPQVHFRLTHDGRNMADYVAAANVKDRLHQVLGRDIAAKLIPYEAAEGACRITANLSAAPFSLPNARALFAFVNRRYVRDKVLTHAVIQGYANLLMKGKYPAAVLFLDLPFDQVDVNVHPAKYEVRFRRQSEVHEAVVRAVRAALKEEARWPSMAGAPPSPHPGGDAVTESSVPYLGPAIPGNAVSPALDIFAAPARVLKTADGFFSTMTILGQILGCYWVCSTARGFALIDQHAAHERVAFEKLRRQLKSGAVQKQHLLIPQAVELRAGELSVLEERLWALDHLGFVIEPFGPDSYAITAVPALLPEADYRDLVQRMVAELADVQESDALRQCLEDRLATMACHSVVRANRRLELDEMRALLNDLDEVEFATQCPHGRPVVLEFGRDDLEKMFKRRA